MLNVCVSLRLDYFRNYLHCTFFLLIFSIHDVHLLQLRCVSLAFALCLLLGAQLLRSSPLPSQTHTHSLVMRYEHRNDCNVAIWSVWILEESMFNAHWVFSTRIFYVNLFTEMIRLPPQTMLCVRAVSCECAARVFHSTWHRRRSLPKLLPRVYSSCARRYVGICVAVGELSDFVSWKIEKEISFGVTIRTSVDTCGCDFFASLLLSAYAMLWLMCIRIEVYAR